MLVTERIGYRDAFNTFCHRVSPQRANHYARPPKRIETAYDIITPFLYSCVFIANPTCNTTVTGSCRIRY